MRRFALDIVRSLVTVVAMGKLHSHISNVGPGMGAGLISPQGETVLFDDGFTGQPVISCAARF
jgi:hypothetical protein